MRAAGPPRDRRPRAAARRAAGGRARPRFQSVPMRILIALTYYRPHVSGLTIYAERLARGLARRGHAVTVLTARFAPRLAAREAVDGVDDRARADSRASSARASSCRASRSTRRRCVGALRRGQRPHAAVRGGAARRARRACAGAASCSPTSATCGCRAAGSTASSRRACARSTASPPPARTPS